MRLVPALVLSAVLLPLASAAAADETTEWAARHILVSHKDVHGSSATRTRDEARTLAERVAAEAKAPGADFEALSRRYSDDKVSDAQGGFLGYFERGKMTPQFQEAVERLREGELSGVVETPFGFHVVQRLSRAEADAILAKTRAVVIAAVFGWKGASKDPGVVRSKETALDDATKTMEYLRTGGTFESIPPVYGAVPFAGGWQARVFPRGGMKPEYRALGDEAFATAVGNVSRPIETPIGYVVFRRMPFFRMHVQHLLVVYKGGAVPDPSITRSKVEARARAEAALKRYEADPSSWSQIVREMSDDPSNSASDGDLAAVKEPGVFVPSFDAAIAPLKVGEHTKVFETPYGFHIARRVP
jgi:parvulin-like peptidyl-prolyl isomerase